MKIVRSYRAIEHQKIDRGLRALQELGAITDTIELIARGSWYDKNGDPWNTPRKLEYKFKSRLLNQIEWTIEDELSTPDGDAKVTLQAKLPEFLKYQ